MRSLALDVGDERIGVAISDEQKILARPLEIIARRAGPSSFQRIAALVAEYGVGSIVVGLALLSDGSEGKQARSTRAYVQGLVRHVDIPITFWNERHSTQQARAILDAMGSGDIDEERRMHKPRHKRQRRDDAVAAAVILQEYLNTQSELGSHALGDAAPGGLNS